MTIASATLSPRAVQASSSFRTSFIVRCPPGSTASSSSEASELPARSWSVYGSAACIPRVSGS